MGLWGAQAGTLHTSGSLVGSADGEARGKQEAGGGGSWDSLLPDWICFLFWSPSPQQWFTSWQQKAVPVSSFSASLLESASLCPLRYARQAGQHPSSEARGLAPPPEPLFSASAPPHPRPSLFLPWGGSCSCTYTLFSQRLASLVSPPSQSSNTCLSNSLDQILSVKITAVVSVYPTRH